MKSLIPRLEAEGRIEEALRHHPVALLLGPRQCGKSTLARAWARRNRAEYFDLEDPLTPLRPDTAALTLRGLRGRVVIDEFQRQPKLFELLRVLADRKPLPARFLVLGSAGTELVRGLSESLAGRVAFVDLGGFSLPEVGARREARLWLRGGFPRSFLAPDEAQSFRWRLNFIQSFLERDLPQLGIRIPAVALRRFWTMLAHVHGRLWNASDLARSMSVQEDTARRYLDVLTGSFMIRQLQPWFENTGKRLVKSPKIYFRDTGLLHALLNLRRRSDLITHPALGFSWEGFALEETVRALQADRDAYFYRTQAGAELDLAVIRGGRRYGFEFKYGDAPAITPSMRNALEDLKLRHLWVIYPGDQAYPLAEKITLLPLTQLKVARQIIDR